MSQTTNQAPAQQGKDPALLPVYLKKLGRMLLNNWGMKLLSLLLALGLWAGLITQDPTLTREKTFRDVNVTINNQETFKRNGYTVTSDLEELLDGVNITVDVPQKQYADAQASNYNVRVDLNRLANRTGEQELTILSTSTSTYGTVTKITPSTITVTVEEYVTHGYIPVNVVRVGEAPEGFYVTEATKEPSWITVSGPRSLVERVDRAEVLLDLSELPAREGKVDKALAFALLDAEGQPIVSDMLQVTRESVLRERINISVTLYAERDIEVLNAQLYAGTPAEGYEVTDVYVSPSYVTVAGLKSVVDSVNLLQPGKLVNVNGATETVTATIDLSKPLNLQWMSTSKVSVTVVIQPRNETVRLEGIPVRVTGVPQGMMAAAVQDTAVVSITGAGAWVKGLTAKDVSLSCDVSALTPGVQEAALQCTVQDSDGQEFVVEIEPQTVQVVIAPQSGR